MPATPDLGAEAGGISDCELESGLGYKVTDSVSIPIPSVTILEQLWIYET